MWFGPQPGQLSFRLAEMQPFALQSCLSVPQGYWPARAGPNATTVGSDGL